MKKLMMAAVAVCMATVTQAAAMNWSVKTDAAGEMVYICTTGSDFESLADIIAAQYGTSGNTGVSAGVGRQPFSEFMAQGTVGGLADDTQGMQNFYAVVVDGSGKGYYSKMGSGEVYTTSYEPVLGEVDMASLISSGNYTPWSGTPVIPEPTSGLLLLLGVAGLALKRKQA